ncbi:hypothetical protein [Longimicrobium sp.]|uniref:hypothetical protein n=1 Tax=Longimicrobium sp. TaxID=2029185 RepID=UPI002CE577E2|nr:hypothetical protein [Longimicrobium sp.]HSU15207.1 hypothetical protein [Longimicrobium sp.]
MNARPSFPAPTFAAPSAAPAAKRERRPDPWVPAFMVFVLLCGVLLLVPGIGPLRMALRIATFGGSLVLLAGLRGRGGIHPAAPVGLLAMLVVVIQVMSPGTTSLLAGTAHATLYLAVMGPLFWVPRLDPDVRVIQRVALILWVFHTASAALGVLQVYFPGQFQPQISAVIANRKDYLDALMITTTSGIRVFRPMGLTDLPGGAAISGLYAVLFGTGFFLTRRTPWTIAASALSMVIGMTCLYLSQVRAVLVMTGIAVVMVVAILIWRRDLMRVWALGGTAVAMAIAGYGVAVALAGPSVAKRVATLTASRPGAVYYHERGHFFTELFTNILPKSPFGMGLGHWGMMATYFGRPGDASPGVWVEIQWAGWIVDGGIPLALFYATALVMALWAAWKVARAPAPAGAPELPFWGIIVLAYGVGAFALTFSYPIFLSQPGMEFWLLISLLYAVARHERRRARLAAAPAAAPATA